MTPTCATKRVTGRELRALRRLQPEQGIPKSPFMFVSERGAPFVEANDDLTIPPILDRRAEANRICAQCGAGVPSPLLQ
jgi:hypothetical protein